MNFTTYEMEILEILLEWEETPDYGNLYTIKDFSEMVKSGGFIPYDGF